MAEPTATRPGIDPILQTLLDAFVTPLLVLAFGRNAVERLKAAAQSDSRVAAAASY